MTRMMKIVPASRLVSEASLEPPIIARNRPVSKGDRFAGAGWVSVMATAKSSAREARHDPDLSNDSLRFCWVKQIGLHRL
jgi:hypothetical protein